MGTVKIDRVVYDEGNATISLSNIDAGDLAAALNNIILGHKLVDIFADMVVKGVDKKTEPEPPRDKRKPWKDETPDSLMDAVKEPDETPESLATKKKIIEKDLLKELAEKPVIDSLIGLAKYKDDMDEKTYRAEVKKLEKEHKARIEKTIKPGIYKKSIVRACSCGNPIRSKTGKLCPHCLLVSRQKTQAKVAKARTEARKNKESPPAPAKQDDHVNLEFNSTGTDDLLTKDTDKIPIDSLIETRLESQIAKGVNQLPYIMMNIYGQVPETTGELWNAYQRVWLDVIYQDEQPESG